MAAVRVWRGEGQRTAAVRSLAASERRLRSISQSALDGIVSADMSGRIVFWNSSAAKMFGHGDLKMAGLSVSQILTLSAEGIEASVPALAGRVSTVFEAMGIASNGGELPLEVSVTQWSTDDESFLTLILRDISERRHAEAVQDFLRGRLEQANRVNGLGRVVATVAHEFNNVLMGIHPFVDILRRPEVRERYIDLAVETIEGAIRRGKKVTEEILRFTQSGDAVLRPLDARRWLHSFIPEADSMLGAKNRLEVVLPDEETFILADPQLLQQIVANIVVNARDAMPDGGTVTITLAGRVQDNDLPLSAVQGSDRYVHLTICDEGVGMPPEVLERIFEPLYTTKPSGTGLGLSVSRQLVLRQQGEMLVDSTPGAGTTFHILLQRTSERPEKEEPKRAAARSVSSVVLVEDDGNVGEGLCAALEMVGTRVRWVDRGAGAVAAVEQTAPDAVILDIDLPDIDGIEVYRQLAARWPSLPVVFSTGHSTDISSLPVAGRTNVALLLKPYGVEELLSLLDSLVAPGRSARSTAPNSNPGASAF
jgi:PAS domain S-box-containing protein